MAKFFHKFLLCALAIMLVSALFWCGQGPPSERLLSLAHKTVREIEIAQISSQLVDAEEFTLKFLDRKDAVVYRYAVVTGADAGCSSAKYSNPQSIPIGSDELPINILNQLPLTALLSI